MALVSPFGYDSNNILKYTMTAFSYTVAVYSFISFHALYSNNFINTHLTLLTSNSDINYSSLCFLHSQEANKRQDLYHIDEI